MRQITPELTPEIEHHIGNQRMSEATAYPVSSYLELVKHIAKLAHLNKDYLLFFRGQAKDHINKAGSSTIYPSIYRGDRVTHNEILRRFQVLEESSRQLSNLFEEQRINGYRELIRKTFIQWSILQHYEVCNTPLLDLTHSIPVACSFAQHDNNHPKAYVFVFGLPYITNRISINSEHDLVNVRLLSISPPDALRPYFQEGYLAGTTDITTEYPDKTELDFRNRLIAKFRIPNNNNFWERGFSIIPNDLLKPENDRVKDLCRSIKVRVQEETFPGEIGKFISIWNNLEQELVSWARDYEDRVNSTNTSLSVLSKYDLLGKDLEMELHNLRKFRNKLVHKPTKLEKENLSNRIYEVKNMINFVNDLKHKNS